MCCLRYISFLSYYVAIGKLYSFHLALGMTEVLAGDPAPLKVITLFKEETEPLGFSIRGGSEHGLGIFVSEVEPATAAGLYYMYFLFKILEVILSVLKVFAKFIVLSK